MGWVADVGGLEAEVAIPTISDCSLMAGALFRRRLVTIVQSLERFRSGSRCRSHGQCHQGIKAQINQIQVYEPNLLQA